MTPIPINMKEQVVRIWEKDRTLSTAVVFVVLKHFRETLKGLGPRSTSSDKEAPLEPGAHYDLAAPHAVHAWETLQTNS
jgi:hypothetical protein